MEWKLESTESERNGAIKQHGCGQVIRPLPAREQLRTRSCTRCAGLLVTEWCYDLDNAGTHRIETIRCVQCGHRVDPVILQNQIRSLVDSQPLRQARPRYSTRAGILSEMEDGTKNGAERGNMWPIVLAGGDGVRTEEFIRRGREERQTDATDSAVRT